MLLSQAFLCTVSVMASVVIGYKLDFYDFDGSPGTGCESDQLVRRGTWSGDASAECTPFKSDGVKYVRITKNDKTDDEHQVLFSNSDDCSETNALRFQEGCFDISEIFPDVKSYRIIPLNNHTSLEKAVDSWWASNSDSWSPIYIGMTTAAGVTAVNAIRSSHGEQIATAFAAIGRPLWAFVSSRFISSILIAQVFAIGAVYLKQHWLLGNETGGSCEKSESKLDVLTQIITKVVPADDIESIKAVVKFKDGRTMTISHPAVDEKAK
ncbi:uncharacterized protein N7496_001516 [Penicillium cataractarum]|uniref:Uncharacterized protein n=1 Tax=Penicillium cataractarum TaxID=2100454 RepID=A0A9W9VW90_9EURO|nr:uncharacterized protein N7496_001516 [Penicillium cataractarum]KAJ5390448.1 hypothetical protein N7496_001516 [Penicillium cataractarum]